MVGKGLHFMMSFKMCLHQLQEMQGFMSCGSKPMFFYNLFFVFSLTCRHCYFDWWHLHIGDVIIVDPTQANLVSQVVFSHGVTKTMGTQVKEGLYHDCYLVNVFLLLAIEVFRCLHLQSNSFFHRCASMAWTTKGTKGPHLLVLHSFYRQKVWMVL
jgi:hypothetical protein